MVFKRSRHLRREAMMPCAVYWDIPRTSDGRGLVRFAKLLVVAEGSDHRRDSTGLQRNGVQDRDRACWPVLGNRRRCCYSSDVSPCREAP